MAPLVGPDSDARTQGPNTQVESKTKCDFSALICQTPCMTLSGVIPSEVAMQLYEEIRREKERRWFSQCWGCVKASKGDVTKMCVSSRPDYRGCSLVNERYKSQSYGKERPRRT